MSASPLAGGNRLLARLPPAVRDGLLAASNVTTLQHGQELYRQNGLPSYVYFPTHGMLSVVVNTTDGRAVEAATVGAEGMVGLPTYLGLNFAPHTAVCQVSGEAVRVSVAALRDAVKGDTPLDRLLRLYTAYSLRYANQTIACNALHTVEERACRWLLMTHDRVRQDEFTLTHEYLAQMLGVHRQTVSLVAGTLQRAGLISYRRGQLRVLNREELEYASCECYRVTTDLYERIMA